jgi:hypothetical protein
MLLILQRNGCHPVDLSAQFVIHLLGVYNAMQANCSEKHLMLALISVPMAHSWLIILCAVHVLQLVPNVLT